MHTLTVRTNRQTLLLPFDGNPTVADVLRGAGIPFRAECGGRGTCGKCLVSASGAISGPDDAEKRFVSGVLRLACRARLLGDAEVILRQDRVTVIPIGPSPRIAGKPTGTGIGIAVDLGTTTIAAQLYDLSSGKLLGQAACDNPQACFGADVMGRISAAAEGHLPMLCALARQAILSLADTVCRESGTDRARLTKGTVVGNTTMMYLLCGLDPDVLGHAPFSPIADFSEGIRFGGIGFSFLPPIDAFVGSDTTAALLASGMLRGNASSLLCDIGTNGEIALLHEGNLFTCSCAAGPAFEGAGISCGCPAMEGAVRSVWLEDGEIRFATVGGAPEIGICGSGLLDAAAAFLERGDLDRTGYAAYGLKIGKLTLTAEDVRALQLAKAAIAGGIRTLCGIAGISPKRIGNLLIAGGFGSSLDPESAAAVGLFPAELLGVTRAIGNAALAGAALALLSEETAAEAARIAERAIPCPLGGRSDFRDHFLRHLSFENDWNG